MLRLKEIGKQFENGRVALREISLEISPRTIVSVVGASGSGKSTLLRLVSGLEMPTTGDLTWNDQSIVGPRRDIGFIQDSEEQVNEINRQLKADGFHVPPPSRQHGSWTFYFDAPGGFTIEVMA